MDPKHVERILNPDLSRFREMSDNQVVMLALNVLLANIPASVDINEIRLELVARSEDQSEKRP